MRLQRSGRVVQQHARGAEIRQLSGLLHEGMGLACPPRAVDEAGLELAAGSRDGVRCLAQVGDVVQRVVQPEDVDAVLRRTGDEPSDEIVVDRARADEKTAPKREAERRLHIRLEGADPFPRALYTAPAGAVETTAARDLEVRVAGPVEDRRNSKLLGRRQPPRERFLAQQADGGIGERRHAGSLASCRARIGFAAMKVQELKPGLWRWTASHPEWEHAENWGPEVGSVY